MHIFSFSLVYFAYVFAKISGEELSLGNGTEMYETGIMNDGRYSCPYDYYCRKDGKFLCKCPGNGQEVYNIIRCFKKHRFIRKCFSGFPIDSKDSCKSCKGGWLRGPGDCTVDINECQTNNGNCQQKCTNTIGSYFCTCRPGHTLDANKHKCIKSKCFPLKANAPLIVKALNSNNVESYSVYSCSQSSTSKRVIIGAARRKCIASGSILSWANSPVPKCYKKCSRISPSNRKRCARNSVAQNICLEMGCCYIKTSNNSIPYCFKNNELAYVNFGNKKPTNGSPFAIQVETTLESCNYQCQYLTKRRCKSFALQNTGDKTFKKCLMYSKKSTSYSMKSDRSFEFYSIMNPSNYDD